MEKLRQINTPVAQAGEIEKVASSAKEQTILVEKPSENKASQSPREINGPRGLEPTRYGDWEANGRCYDF